MAFTRVETVLKCFLVIVNVNYSAAFIFVDHVEVTTLNLIGRISHMSVTIALGPVHDARATVFGKLTCNERKAISNR